MASFVNDTLAAFKKAAAVRREAEASYRSALLGAFDELEQSGARHPYATIAAAAGISRQAARMTVKRARAWRASVPGYDLAEHDVARRAAVLGRLTALFTFARDWLRWLVTGRRP